MANKLYNEASVQSIANSLRLKRDGNSETYTIGEMSDSLLSLPFGNIPSYHITEARRVIQKIAELKKEYPRHIVFGTISDNHVDKTNADSMRSARHAVYALETVGVLACDFIANLGDNISAGSGYDSDTTLADAMYMEESSRYALTNAQKSFNLIGNHDKSNSTEKLFGIIGKYNEFDVSAPTQIRGFGYKDFEDKYVRVITLNTCDYWNSIGGNGMSYEQKVFLMEALDLSDKTNYANWTIIVLSHIPLDFLGGDYNKGADLKAILKAYNDGTTVSISVNSNYASKQNESNKYSGTLSYNYAGKNSPKIINIHGHIHTNKYGKLKFIDDNTELNMTRISTSNSSFTGNASTDRYTEYGDYSITKEEANKIAKVAGTKADTSATFYFFDLDNQIIHCIGYGADIDRTVIYKDAVLYAVTYDLDSGVTINDTSDLVVEGASLSRTLTLRDQYYAYQSVKVTMGGVDITSSAYSNGKITISKVTGNVSITVSTVDNYVPVWDIGNRTAVTTLYKVASNTAELSRHNYYWGAASTGAILNNRVASCRTSGNDVTFTMTEKSIGIGIPYHLEPNASYIFSATSSVKGRIRYCVLNADGSSADVSEYGGSGTTHSLTFTAPADKTKWVMLILDAYTANEEVTYTNISLTNK